ncbi:MAG: TlpA family protein disulfide reductase [Rhizobacter sp.]|nr:TlpA family protein disulfide reductase [Chlorobiales bacterium]
MKSFRIVTSVLSALLVVAVAAAFTGKATKAPEFELKTVDGKTLKLSDYKGKAVILNFWGTWCPPCRAEIPDMVELQKQYGGEKFTFIGVTVNERKGVEAVQAFMKQANMNYPVALAGEEAMNAYTQLLPEDKRGYVPATFVINAKGEVIDMLVGGQEKATFEAAIKKALK